jgi:hypothetical protein
MIRWNILNKGNYNENYQELQNTNIILFTLNSNSRKQKTIEKIDETKKNMKALLLYVQFEENKVSCIYFLLHHDDLLWIGWIVGVGD